MLFDKNNDNAEDTMSPQGVRVSSPDLTLPENTFTYTGYTLDHWNTKSDDKGTSYADKAAITVSKDITLYAFWKIVTYTLSYDLQGGTVSKDNPTSYDITTPAFKLTNPTKTGYTFAGWTGSADVTSSKDVEIPQGSTGNRSYTANYTAIAYTISYDLAGGTNDSDNPATYTIETDAINLNTPTKKGYTFTGWIIEGVEGTSTDVTIQKGSTGSRTYTATWHKDVYSITYTLNEGIVSPDDNPTSYDVESDDIHLRKPTRTGYTFDGWTGTSLDVASTDVTIPKGSTGNREYTANFTVIVYTLSYDLRSGDVSPDNPASYTVDSDDFTLTRPTRLGYDFKGWSFDEEISLDVTIPQGSTGNREFTALWELVTYTISYDLQNGTVSTDNPVSYDVESGDITLVNPTKAGYTFIGWTGTSVDVASSMDVKIPAGSTGNREYTANYTIITYTISYDLNGGTVATDNPTSYDV